uniref:Exosome-associated factor Rrp6 N-terminal domain-containing protein n=1 Tax=Ditylenchus dipsaci TaxID=166011 RepID=A0A915CQS3_9BILA
MSEETSGQAIKDPKSVDIATRNKNKNEEFLKLTVAMIRASNDLPSKESGFELFASFPEYLDLMKHLKLRMIVAIRKLSLSAGCRAKIPATGLEDMEKIMYANDLLVERAGTSFDKHNSLLTQQYLVKQNPSLIGGKAAAVPGSIQSSSLSAKIEALSYYDAQVNAGTSKKWEEEKMAVIFAEKEQKAESRISADG